MSRQPTTDQLPLVSVVFLAHNRRDALRESIRRMTLESGYPADRLEVIVVDNASSDGTPSMIRQDFPEVALVETGRNLGAPGWNAGFAAARGDYVLILDDDAYLKPGGLECAVRAARREEAGLVSFSVVSSYDESYSYNDEYRTGLLSYWGCAALVSRPAMDVLGGYDPAIFIWGNELEFTMRLLDHGFVHLFMPDVIAIHMKEPGAVFTVPKARFNYRHWSYTAAKLMTPVDAAAVLAILLLGVLLGTLAEDRRTIAAFPQVLAGFVTGLKNRAPMRPTVSRAYRESWRGFAWPLQFVRSPAERWRVYRQREDPDQQRKRRYARYFTNRPDFYPIERASLKL